MFELSWYSLKLQNRVPSGAKVKCENNATSVTLIPRFRRYLLSLPVLSQWITYQKRITKN